MAKISIIIASDGNNVVLGKTVAKVSFKASKGLVAFGEKVGNNFTEISGKYCKKRKEGDTCLSEHGKKNIQSEHGKAGYP